MMENKASKPMVWAVYWPGIRFFAVFTFKSSREAPDRIKQHAVVIVIRAGSEPGVSEMSLRANNTWSMEKWTTDKVPAIFKAPVSNTRTARIVPVTRFFLSGRDFG